MAALAAELDSGRRRASVMADFAVSQTDAVAGSPTFRLPDGSGKYSAVPGNALR